MSCMTVLIALEILLKQSQQHEGIASVQAESMLRYTWLYIPTAILALISIIFGTISFNLKLAHPYYGLAHGFTSAKTSLFWNPAGYLPLRTAWRALRTTKWPLAFSFIATLFAPLLTIVASGLFPIQNVPDYTSRSLNAHDWFNMSGIVSDASMVAGLVITTNMTYSTGTYDEFVFPSVDFDDISDFKDLRGNLSIILPALRARLDCHSISDQDIANITLVNGTLHGGMSVPDNCGYPIHPTHIDMSELYQTFPNLGPDFYFGNFINFYDWSDLDPTLWCATPFFTFYGRASSTSSTGMNDFQAYLCSRNLDVLNANVTYGVATSSTVERPIVDESTSRNFFSWNNRYTFPSFWTNYGETNASLVSAYLSASITGRDGIGFQQFTDPSTFLEQLQHVHRQYLAQLINFTYRNGGASTNATFLNGVRLDSLEAVHIDDGHPRLIQSAISTHILAAVLGLLVMCSTVI